MHTVVGQTLATLQALVILLCNNMLKIAPQVVMQALVKGGANVNEPDSDGMTPLVAACHTSQHELVKELLAARADPNLAEADGQTPLIAAAENGNVQMIQNLLEAGADVDATDSDYQTPLMAAAAEGCIDSVKVLLSAGADASHCDEEGTTVLMVAEFAEELMDMLLSAGADVNAMDGDDETALYKAARLADAEYVEWLLRHGADPYQATVMEQTALDAAYMAQGEALSDANGVIALLEAFTVDDDMDTESQNGSEVVEASGDEPDSPNSLLA